MNRSIDKIKSDVKKLKIVLTINTVILTLHLLLWFTIEYHGIHPLVLFGLLGILSFINLIVYIIFIYYISSKYPDDQKSKLNNTLMVLFLGIIGMWLWIPTEKEIDKKFKKTQT